jgi:hypothetical protein
MFVTGEDGVWRGWEGRCAKRAVTVAGMDMTMSSGTRQEVLKKLRRRYQGAGIPPEVGDPGVGINGGGSDPAG